MPEPQANTIAFVASLLPARFILNKAKSLGVSEIVVLSDVHEKSYKQVASEIGNVRVRRLRGQTRRDVVVIVRVALARLRGRRVLFFHECCWPAFDLAVAWFKPQGLFYPHVEMEHEFKAVDLSEMPRGTNWRSRLRRKIFSLLKDQFIIYRGPMDSGSSDHNYFVALRQYPETIEKFPISAGWTSAEHTDSPHSDRQVILIGGTDAVDDEYLKSVFVRLADVAAGAGYKVFFKDHPVHQLKVESSSFETLSHERPLALLKEPFDFAIGVASVGLLEIGRRKIAIVKALDRMPPDIRQRREMHLRALPNADRIEFVDSLDDVEVILREARQAS